jgi:hypothetical protein
MSDEEDEWEDNYELQQTAAERVIDLNIPLAPAPKKRKRRVTTAVTTAEKQSLRDNHRQHLRTSLQNALLIASCSYDEEIVVTCLSMLPFELINSSTQTMSFLQLFTHWFQSNYEIIKNSDLTIEEGRDGSLGEDLINILKKSVGSSHQLCQIAIAFLTALNFRVRYTVTIDLESSTTTSTIPSAWIEVWIPSPASSENKENGKWFCLEISKNILSSNKKIIEIECRVRRSSLSYVISIDQTGHVEDVTFAYASNPMRTRGKRLNKEEDQQWWEELLSSKHHRISSDHLPLSTSVPPSTLGGDESTSMKALPQSISGYRNHPYYALAGPDHLGKRQILHPEAKRVAVFAGHSVYLRRDICELKTRLQWKRLNREILPDQLPIPRSLEPPASSTTCQDPSSSSSSSSSSSAAAAAAPHASHSHHDLFADYQTKEKPPLEMTIDSFGNKQIPRNKHGNIEIWDGKKEYLPRGCTYLSSSYATQAAHLLGLSHVPALIGFKSIGVMKFIPILQGVVIQEEDLELVSEAALVLETQDVEKEKEKKYLKIIRKWQQLCRGMVSRVRLLEEYGH